MPKKEIAAQAEPTVTCEYCRGQGIDKLAFQLHGKDAETDKKNVVRYGCSNGHRFGVKQEGK